MKAVVTNLDDEPSYRKVYICSSCPKLEGECMDITLVNDTDYHHMLHIMDYIIIDILIQHNLYLYDVGNMYIYQLNNHIHQMLNNH